MPTQEQLREMLRNKMATTHAMGETAMSTLGTVTPEQEQAHRQRLAMRQAGQMGQQTAGVYDQGLKQRAAQRLAGSQAKAASMPQGGRGAPMRRDAPAATARPAPERGAQEDWYPAAQARYRDMLASELRGEYGLLPEQIDDATVAAYEGTLAEGEKFNRFMVAAKKPQEQRQPAGMDQLLRQKAAARLAQMRNKAVAGAGRPVAQAVSGGPQAVASGRIDPAIRAVSGTIPGQYTPQPFGFPLPQRQVPPPTPPPAQPRPQPQQQPVGRPADARMNVRTMMPVF